MRNLVISYIEEIKSSNYIKNLDLTKDLTNINNEELLELLLFLYTIIIKERNKKNTSNKEKEIYKEIVKFPK